MRPPAPMTRQWVSEKNSFPVRGLVMYRWPAGWACNVTLLRLEREQIDKQPVEEVAYEIALSAVHRYMTSMPGYTYEGETTPLTTVHGKSIAMPTLAFDLARYLVGKVSTIIQDGGGALNLTAIAATQKTHARETTGSAKDAEGWNLPKLASSAGRKQNRLDYEARLSSQQLKAMATRRKTLAKFWLKNKNGFHRRGLVFTSNAGLFWQFNLNSGLDLCDPVPQDSTDTQLLRELALSASRATVDAFASAINVEKGEHRYLLRDRFERGVEDALTREIREKASERLASRLLKGMTKHKHGIIGLATIERCLVVAWDPEDAKPLDEYPFPLAPTESTEQLDRWALDTLTQRQRRFAGAQSAAAQAPVPVHEAARTWREELEIEDWVPLEEPDEDDETIDQRAMQLADHEQSAALRRIRLESGGSKKKLAETPSILHEIDYAGLPKDVD